MSKEKAKPIRPNEAQEEKEQSIPDEAIEAFNELLAEGNFGGQVRIGQNEVVARMEKKGLSRGEIFAKGWLDVEEIYRKAGWVVEYDKPGYNETYEAYFTFTPRRKNVRRRE